MINWIKNYIDRKVEEKFKEEKQAIQKEKNKAINEVSSSANREIAKAIGNIIEKWKDDKNIIYFDKNCAKTTAFKELEDAVINVVTKCFRRELDNLHNRYDNLTNIRSEIYNKLDKYAENEEFIQKIIDNINEKQLKK